jgi:hypothetical protein
VLLKKEKEMKKLLLLSALLVFAALPACAKDPSGFIWQNTTAPLAGSSNVAAAKTGTAVCNQYFGVVATGDCSLRTAMQNGKINSLGYADQQAKLIFGFGKITTTAYGN